ncbi:Hypothetical predicted protein [Marmota monax]|uniref:Uncharacterized protein n=1 Tax=Marmota monax TaxID=9995 RepID=A0A5E4AM23_MARMO|nr:hypothetical protein GHT09_003237 [Marmota monax]VTJ58275.1 Hypothetical predicted protein [Marmota monax]
MKTSYKKLKKVSRELVALAPCSYSSRGGLGCGGGGGGSSEFDNLRGAGPKLEKIFSP